MACLLLDELETPLWHGYPEARVSFHAGEASSLPLLNPKRAGGGRNPPTATLKACRAVCDEAGGIKPSCNFHFGCLEQVDNINFGGCL